MASNTNPPGPPGQDSKPASIPVDLKIVPDTKSWLTGNTPVYLWFGALILVTVLLALSVQVAGKKLLAILVKPRNGHSQVVFGASSDGSKQAEAEELLQRAAANDAAADDQILAKSESWIGRTRRTPRANQFITVALNSHDLHIREAALQADLAMDGVPWNQRGLDRLEQAVKIPSQRAWALWTLGALGNRGVDPARAGSLIASYLSDPDVNVRVAAVTGLAVLGSDESVSLLLDRFRNDSSPVVQEQAACGLAESGMYNHEQRMTATASLVGWLDDPLISSQQRTWALLALHDISGQNLGNDSAAWRQWFENAR